MGGRKSGGTEAVPRSRGRANWRGASVARGETRANSGNGATDLKHFTMHAPMSEQGFGHAGQGFLHGLPS